MPPSRKGSPNAEPGEKRAMADAGLSRSSASGVSTSAHDPLPQGPQSSDPVAGGGRVRHGVAGSWWCGNHRGAASSRPRPRRCACGWRRPIASHLRGGASYVVAPPWRTSNGESAAGGAGARHRRWRPPGRTQIVVSAASSSTWEANVGCPTAGAAGGEPSRWRRQGMWRVAHHVRRDCFHGAAPATSWQTGRPLGPLLGGGP